MNTITEHFVAILLDFVERHLANKEYACTPETAADSIKGNYLLDFGVERMKRTLEMCHELGFAERIYSPMTNGFYLVKRDFALKRFGLGTWFSDDAIEIQPGDGLHETYPVIYASLVGGAQWTDHVAAAMRQRPLLWQSIPKEDVESVQDVPIPASDRIVTLGDNAIGDLEAESDVLIGLVEAETSLEEDGSFKAFALGQVKAGRELIRAKTFSAYLMYHTMLSMLGTLIEKYKGQAIGEAAKKLLGLLLEHVFKAN